jgi:murein DD-endopeptidase MepM/ murein hydrolase activator NlpD
MLDEPTALDHREWPMAACAAERRRSAKTARLRRRRRRLVVVLFAAAVLVSLVLAAAAYAMPEPYARACLADVGGRSIGRAAATVAKEDNASTWRSKSDDAAASWRLGRAYASSTVIDERIESIAAVTLYGVSLLDGRVRAARLDLLASATATRGVAHGEAQGSHVSGLSVDGKSVSMADLPLAIDGLGTLSALTVTTREAGDGVETQLTGLVLSLSGDWHDLPAGAEVVAGELSVGADSDAARRLIPAPKPSAESPEKPTPTPSATGGSHPEPKHPTESAEKPKPKPADPSGPGGAGAGSAGGGSGGASGASTSGYSPGPMPAPKPVDTTRLLHFPGAVFPVKGKYWYGDDFGVLRSPGNPHTGNDIFALRGTPLVAVQDGTIEELRWRSLGGNSLHLLNDRGDYFYYAHLDHYAVGIRNGTRVSAGEVIGFIGNTGNARTTAPHCHFEIHPGSGDAVDPFPYLEEWRGAKVMKLVPTDDGTAPDGAHPGREAAQASAQSNDRHASFALPAILNARRDEPTPGSGGMLPLAASFGAGGALVTALVRRRRLDWSLLLPLLDTRQTSPPSDA